jgi:uncharacterized protein YbjT (DUF2867 family)
MIVLTGATGNVGARLLSQLVAKGTPVRVLARAPEKVPTGPTVDVVKGDLTDAAVRDRAFAGASTLFLLTSSFPGSADLQDATIASAKAAGIKRVVRLSAVGAMPQSPVTLSRWHAQTDATLKASGLAYTLLAPGFFMQNFYGNLPTIRKEGAFYGNMPTGAVCWIDATDIASAARVVLTDTSDTYLGKTLTLTGPEPLTLSEVAARFTTFLGKPVHFVNLPSAAFRAGLVSAGVPEWMANDYVAMYELFETGIGKTPDPTLGQLLGSTRTFNDFLAAEGGAFRA